MLLVSPFLKTLSFLFQNQAFQSAETVILSSIPQVQILPSYTRLRIENNPGARSLLSGKTLAGEKVLVLLEILCWLMNDFDPVENFSWPVQLELPDYMQLRLDCFPLLEKE